VTSRLPNPSATNRAVRKNFPLNLSKGAGTNTSPVNCTAYPPTKLALEKDPPMADALWLKGPHVANVRTSATVRIEIVNFSRIVISSKQKWAEFWAWG